AHGRDELRLPAPSRALRRWSLFAPIALRREVSQESQFSFTRRARPAYASPDPPITPTPGAAMRRVTSSSCVLATVVLTSLLSGPAHAQGFAPGTGTISVNYAYTKIWNHLFGGPFNRRGINVGKSRDLGQIMGQGASMDVGYNLVRNVSIDASVAW